LGAWRELILNRHVRLSFLPTYLALAALGWILVKSRRPMILGLDWQALALFMLIYGVLTGIPLLAILSRHYVFPLARILGLTALLVFSKGGLPRIRMPAHGWSSAVGISFASVSVAATLALVFSSARGTEQLVHHLRSASPAYSRFLDHHWDSFMAESTDLIDSRRKRNTVSLWSVNAALLESHYGIFPPAEDYMIHAIGTSRWRHYLATLEQTEPEFVQTMTQEYSFQEGQQDEMWEFFEAVLNNYSPLKTIGHSLFWQRNDGPWRQPAKDLRDVEIAGDQSSALLPVVSEPGPDRIGIVRIHYRVWNRWSFLPLLGKTPRYLVAIEGSPRHLTISVPPGESEFRFPVQLKPGKPVRLVFRTDTLIPGALFRPDQVQIKILDWQPSHTAIYARGSIEAPF
jgi:hypothetical protein